MSKDKVKEPGLPREILAAVWNPSEIDQSKMPNSKMFSYERSLTHV
ncbi:hypothetical protein JOC34_001852 [Virgibacillus halotolerans]|nr:hypothetical protein [Virgibacillus halotolerans]MBM7599484.1 hypothetical protein [Virgibacillus halotolerans]